MTTQAGVVVTHALAIVKDGVDERDFEKFIKEAGLPGVTYTPHFVT